jgi:ATP-binding protein involved in chromosome partitioning
VCSHCGERDDIFGHGGARAAADAEDYAFLGQVPLSSVIREQSDAGEPVALSGDESPYGKAFREIAMAVASQVSIANYRNQSDIKIEM